MKSYTTGMLLAIILSTILLSAIVARPQEDQATTNQNQDNKVENHLSNLPVVDYEAPEPSDVNRRDKRRAKSKTYNDHRGAKPLISEIEIGVLNNEWEWGLASALPSAQSTAVFVGKVSGAQAYLSEDRTNVYSEFTVHVEEVLKNDSTESIAVGASAVTERMGGRVRFPSGRIASIYVSGQSMPQVGRRYLFFLGFNPYEANTKSLTSPRGDMRRHILTAYELRAGRVFPLDQAGGRNFQDYKGKDEMAFLDEVRRSIAATSQASPE